MRNSSLRDRQMNASAFVIQARDWARDVVNADVRGPGDLENAMRRVESRFGITSHTQAYGGDGAIVFQNRTSGRRGDALLRGHDGSPANARRV